MSLTVFFVGRIMDINLSFNIALFMTYFEANKKKVLCECFCCLCEKVSLMSVDNENSAAAQKVFLLLLLLPPFLQRKLFNFLRAADKISCVCKHHI